MRILANENIPSTAVVALRQAGHDVSWVRVDAPGSSDEEVLRRAQQEERLLLTFDKDFGELAFREGREALSGVILLRLLPAAASHLARAVVAVLETRSDWIGHFSVVEEDRIRMTPLGH